MKHVRKMVLVDVNSIKSQESSRISEKNNDALTDAIRSLTASNEFSRDYFGDSAISIAHLNKEMREILDLTGTDTKEKLDLYNRKLQRYLSLLRISENSSQPIQATVPPPPPPQPAQPIYNPFENIEPATPLRRASSEIELPERSATQNSHSREIIRSKYRSNLPRKTPKQDILRSSAERRKTSRYKDYFTNWTPNTAKVRKPKNVK